MKPPKGLVRGSILKLNYDVEYNARIKSGDDPEVAAKAAEIVTLEIVANWEEAAGR